MTVHFSNPKSMFGVLLAIGLVLGLCFGYLINSMTIGVPMGLIASILVGKIAHRLSEGISRLTR